MPITSEQFTTAIKERRADTAETIRAFLKTHNMAYSVKELADELGLDSNLTFDALVDLETLGAVDSGSVRGATYFIYRAA